MSPSRSILLVGEGNFSFSACVSQLYSETDTSVTATCLQHQEEALRNEGTASNIQTIKDSGTVFCVQVLAEDGEVHVSLCNGQGGTQADHPKREWHNSWQVVAMAAEAHLILTDVRPFESEKYQSYKCTGYRSQDKGFHVEKALVHVFTRSLPYTSAETLQLEEAVEGEKVQYNIPAELSDYIFRGFLCSGSVHPVRLVQDFLLKGLQENWSVSMTTKSVPFLLTAKQLQACCCDVDSTHWYWIHPFQKDLNSDPATSTDKETFLDGRGHRGTRDTPSATRVTSDKADRVRSKGAETFRSACSLDVDPEGEECMPMKLIGQSLEALLTPYGVSLVTEQGGLRLMAQPMGVVGRVFVGNSSDISHMSITVSLNLDLLAVLLFSLPDWRLLWSRDPRFLKQFALQPLPGKPFHPFSLFPEHISFDISFWTGPTWEERKFHAVVREASHGTVEQVKLIDTFSHPDLSQTSYCYRLTYHSHTHALSHTQALQFHQHLESLLTSRLEVTIR
ncbi:Ferredoxin-fold anticodon-binding domain-containing protein 1 [Nibea albiflora]|uniref:Ferredoxin-fold anticodon-binding domain-containing protein 1 n=1 Tax=Nibea albiflora TaxID=240163 RepID=A0ACB7F2I4_NIBAL|nr:Ferredoxin-fold anticodon-binding domain-containing protein 1 [Nibea albiflora]